MDDEGRPPDLASTPPPPPPPAPPPHLPYGAPAYGVPGHGYQPPRTEGLVVAAFVVAIVGLFTGICGLPAGIVALVLANQAQQRVDQSGGQLTGGGLLTAARIIAVIAIVISVAGIVLVLAI